MSRTNNGARLDVANRQQRMVGALMILAAVVALVLFAGRPFLAQWRTRETALTAARFRVASLNSVVSQRATLDSLVHEREQQLATWPQRVLRARSRALAASALQSQVQEMADQSHVTVTRLDVADVNAGASNLPITLSANGDIYGLAALLAQLRNGHTVVVLDKLLVQNNSALRGAPDVLQMTLSLHAPVLVE